MKKILLSLVFLCGALSGLQAQKLDHNYMHWYTYFGTAGINQRWSIPFDAQFRIRDGFSDKGQILLRAGLQYAPNKQTGYLMGYAYIPTYSDGVDAWLPEHRIFEQFIYKWPQPSFLMTHRFRLEQRWVGQKTFTGNGDQLKISDWRYGNRLRYFNRTAFPIKKGTQTTNFYFALQNEFFMNLWGNEINDKFIDQNRFLVASGYSVKPNLKLEVGYMNHYQQAASGAQTMNHILHLAVFHDFSL